MRPFASTGILSKVHLHSYDINWDDFHKNYIPKTHLPADYKGDLPSIKEIHEKDRELMLRLKNYFIEEEKQANYEFDHHAKVVRLAPW